MNKQIITFSADEQKLVKTGGINCYASNIVSYIEAHFTLGQNWSGHDSVRAVWSNDNNMTAISTVLDSNGYCVVPFEVLKTMGVVKVNLVGSISVSGTLTDRLTTFPCEALTVARKAKINGSETAPITPSLFEQFIAIVISEVGKVTGMTAEAETLPAGSSATARYENGVLYLGIPQGIQGERGETGADGEDGNGIAQVLYNSDYSITFVFTNGERFTTPSLRGETGPQGAPGQNGRDGTDGRDGADGVTPSLSVGTVTTLPSTEDAYVTRIGTDENPVFNFGIPQGPKGDTGEVSLEQLSELLPTDTASGSIASFPDGQSVIPALSVKAEIEPIQSGSGTPSPDNVRPISGRTEVVTSVVGKNLLPQSEYTTNASGVTNKYITASGKLAAGTTITMSGSAVDGTAVTASNTQIQFQLNGVSQLNLSPSMTTTLSQDIEYDGLLYYTNASLANKTVRLQLERGSVATSYEPYTATTHTTSLGRTVYGGSPDVVSGELVVDRGYTELSEDWYWVKSNSYAGGYYASCANVDGMKTITPFISSHAKTVTRLAEYFSGTCYCDNSINFRIMSETSTLQDWKDYIVAQRENGTPICICYELATPQTYQLDPQTIDLLLGDNNVWTDCGSVEVTYKADVGLYIDKKLNV